MYGETNIDFANFSIEYISLCVCQKLDLIFKLNFSSLKQNFTKISHIINKKNIKFVFGDE